MGCRTPIRQMPLGILFLKDFVLFGKSEFANPLKVSDLYSKERICQPITLANSSVFSQEKIDRIFNFLTTELLGKAGIAYSIASKVLVLCCACVIPFLTPFLVRYGTR